MNNKTRALAESAILIAFGVILSMVKLFDLPYGGSVTIASMFPVIVISYRWGLSYGLVSGMIFGVIQQLLGLNTLSWVTTWQSILAVILLDYVVAFLVCGLGGIFRKPVKNQAAALALGSILVCLLRYACHVVSGATVWAGISIPTAAALTYSFIYNATYMLPEMIITVLVAIYIGSTVDLRAVQPARLRKEQAGGFEASLLGAASGLVVIGGLIVDTSLIFSQLQDAETGEFNFAQIANVEWASLIIVSAICVIAVAALLFIRASLKKSAA